MVPTNPHLQLSRTFLFPHAEITTNLTANTLNEDWTNVFWKEPDNKYLVFGKIQSLSQLLDPSVVAGKGYGQYFQKKKKEYSYVPIRLYLPVLSFFLLLSCNSLKNIDLNNSHQVKPSWDD